MSEVGEKGENEGIDRRSTDKAHKALEIRKHPVGVAIFFFSESIIVRFGLQNPHVALPE